MLWLVIVNSKSDVSALCDSFSSQASTYERRLGGSTRRVIAYIIPLLTGGLVLLGSPCSPGLATVELVKAYPNAHIYSADLALGMMSLMNWVVALNAWRDGVKIALKDEVDFRYADKTFDNSITNFNIFFFPTPTTGA